MLQSYACRIGASCLESEVLSYDVCVCLCVRACELQGVIVTGVPLDMLDHAFSLAGWQQDSEKHSNMYSHQPVLVVLILALRLADAGTSLHYFLVLNAEQEKPLEHTERIL